MELVVYREFALLENLAKVANVKMMLPEISVISDEVKATELKQKQVLLYLLNHLEEGINEEDAPLVECEFNEDGVKQCRGILESELALRQLAEGNWDAMAATTEMQGEEGMTEEEIEEVTEVTPAEDYTRLERRNEFRRRLEEVDLRLEELKRNPLLDEKIEMILVVLDDCFIVDHQKTLYESEQAEVEVRKVEAMLQRYRSRISVMQERAAQRELYRGRMLQDIEMVQKRHPELELVTDDSKAYLYLRSREIADFDYEEKEMLRFERRLRRMEVELSEAK